MIPIPEGLAKRVLEALRVGEADALVGADFCATDAGFRFIAAGLRHDAKVLKATRDELAALLTPKEAT